MMRITPVVKNLLIINVILFFVAGIQGIMPQLFPYFRLAYPTHEYFQPLQLATHMFMHGNMSHLFFNMFALYMFGSALESVFGAKHFLQFYFICGFGAVLLHLGVWTLELNMSTPGSQAYYDIINNGVVGASGAIFGLLAGFGTLFPDNKIMLLFPPIPMKAKYFVMAYAAIELFLGVGNFNTGIAHFAHLGGALFGFLLIRFWQKKGRLRR